jgi:hypothetical protein
MWTYGHGISQGWDSSLAHYPYYKLRNEMISYIKDKKLDPNKIGTDFPNVAGVNYIDLSNESWSFAETDFKKNHYIFYSNVFNGFGKKQLKELKKWKQVKIIESFPVKIILFKNPKQPI